MGKVASIFQESCCPGVVEEKETVTAWAGVDTLPMLLGSVEQEWVQHRIIPANRLEVVPEERDAEESAEKENVIEVHSSGEALKPRAEKAPPAEKAPAKRVPPPLLPIVKRRYP
ncbi:unnamed protein product [Cladocopium goreaui]|uniref:Uncharacterized protein n=1 Tax=Cladocopium goreaui TaxID=2562237 RepID=A0A9P1CCY6_9DINO|nr:unnamed protein product [Cladocopium goreaui]|mmetsp:Transcript_23455/g.51028  ORF Transcript_23455/g.51028 Transcript_23455/m.51028 type:complete len:114 (-) Transcript_23455:68-409(-)